MKQKFKPILLITLFVIMLVLAFIPTKSYTAVREEPGQFKVGKFGLGCECPYLVYYECGCKVYEPEG